MARERRVLMRRALYTLLLIAPLTIPAAPIAGAAAAAGYKAYYNKASEQSVWHEWSWNMADHPGTWYFWAKSIKFIDVGRGVYHFGHDDDLGENPAGSGYSNG